MVPRIGTFSSLTQSLITRLRPVWSTVIKPVVMSVPGKHVRYFTGKAFPWYNALRPRGILGKDSRLQVSQIIPFALNSVSTIDLGKDIANMKNADGYLGLFSDFKNSPSMTHVNRVAILHNLAKFALSSPKNFRSTKKVLKEQEDVFLDLLNSIAADFGKSKPREIASIVWALGKLRENIVWFVSECENEIFKQDKNSITPPAVCQLLNGFALLDLKSSQFFTFVEQRVLDGKLDLKDFENRGLNGMLWSFAKTGNGSAKFYKKIEEEIMQRDVKTFSSEQLGLLLWSFSERDILGDQLFKIIEHEIRERPLEGMTNDGIKRLLRSLAKLRMTENKYSDLFEKLGEEVLARGIHDFETGELALLGWCFARMSPKMEVIFDFLEEEINLREISDFRDHELALLLWSFAKAEYFSADLFTMCQEEILFRNLNLFKAKQLSQLAWAFGRSAVPSSEFYIQLEKQMIGNMSMFSDLELCMVARGFVQASAGTLRLFKEIEEEVLQREMLNKNSDFIQDFAWVFSKCSYQAPLLFDEMVKVIKTGGRSSYKYQTLKIINTAFSKAGKKLPFVQLKNKRNKQGKPQKAVI